MAWKIRSAWNGNTAGHEIYGEKTGKVLFQSFGGIEGTTFEICTKHLKNRKAVLAAKIRRHALKSALDSVGLVKVRGALGGTYYE